MLRNVLLMSASGLVLFSKEFMKSVSQPRMVGSLLTAMLEFSNKVVGMPVSHIELTTVSLVIVMDETAKIFCAVFYDKEDGAEFGQLIASQILRSFVEDYATSLGGVGGGGGAGGGVAEDGGNAGGGDGESGPGDVGDGLDLKDFHDFHFKMAEVVRNSIRPVLDRLQSHRGVRVALLVTDDSQGLQIAHATSEVDQLGVLANLQALLPAAVDIMNVVEDSPTDVWVDASQTTRILLRRMPIERRALVVVCLRSVDVKLIQQAIEEATSMVQKVCLLMSNLAAR